MPDRRVRILRKHMDIDLGVICQAMNDVLCHCTFAIRDEDRGLGHKGLKQASHLHGNFAKFNGNLGFMYGKAWSKLLLFGVSLSLIFSCAQAQTPVTFTSSKF